MWHLLAPLALIAAGVLLSMAAFIFGWSFYAKFTLLSTPYVFGQSFWPLLQAYQGDILPRDIAALGFAVVNSINSFGGFFGPTGAHSLTRSLPHSLTRSLTRSRATTVIGSLRRRTGSFILPLAAASVLICTGLAIFSLLHLVPVLARRAQGRRGKAGGAIALPRTVSSEL